jgi:hypothetical protein
MKILKNFEHTSMVSSKLTLSSIGTDPVGITLKKEYAFC